MPHLHLIWGGSHVRQNVGIPHSGEYSYPFLSVIVTSLSEKSATVEIDHRAGYEAGCIACEIEHRLRDLVGL